MITIVQFWTIQVYIAGVTMAMVNLGNGNGTTMYKPVHVNMPIGSNPVQISARKDIHAVS